MRKGFGWLGWGIGSVLRLPVWVIGGFRRSLTPASATLLFFLVLSLNMLWGYPWVGMFAVFASLLGVGWLTNRLFAPRGVRVSVRMPASATAGESWTIRQHLENQWRLPAMELRVRFDGSSARWRGWHMGRGTRVNLIPAGGRVEIPATLRMDLRGIWRVPDVVVESLFPFHLFRATRRIQSEGTIAITPPLLHAAEEPAIRAGLTAVSGVATQQAAGTSAEYVGSREYQVGMTVRHWDFVSWARLGRPIVREYATPGLQVVAIVVDTGAPELAGRGRRKKLPLRGAAAERFERLLSVAATILVERGRGDLRFRLFVTGDESAGDESEKTAAVVQAATKAPGDVEPLLVRLAAAEPVAPEIADQQIARFLGQSRESEVLVVSTRAEAGFLNAGSRRIQLIRIGSPTAADVRVAAGDRYPTRPTSQSLETSGAGT